MKKSIGVVRKLDPLGRICLPIEVRRGLEMKVSDPLEIFTDGDDIVLRKYQPGCVLCGSLEDLHNIDNTKICMKCAEKIAKAVK